MRVHTRTAVALVALALLACGSGKKNNASLTQGGGGNSPDGGGGGGALGIVLPDSGVAGSSAIEAGDACGESVITSKPKQVNILIVLDESDSMSSTPTGFTQNKWDATRTALTTALQAVQDQAYFGMDVFPTAATCEVGSGANLVVNVDVGSTSVPEIVSTLQTLSPVPDGGTPTAAALKRAYDYFVTGSGASLDGDKYVLLATDGGPNCNPNITCNESACTLILDGNCDTTKYGNCCSLDPSQCLDASATTDQVTALAGKGIKTVVLGIPGSDPYATLLNDLAVAGGVPNTGGTTDYYAVDASGDVAGLTSTIERITANLITTCNFELVTEPSDPNLVKVYIDGQSVTKGTAWTLDSSSIPSVVHLIGDTCNWVKQNGAQSVVIKNGCPRVY